MESLNSVNMLVHVVAGSVWLAAGLAALVAAKGSRRHVLAGKVFAWVSAFVVATALLSMLHEFLPLAIVLALAVVYLVPSALLALNRTFPYYRTLNLLLMVLALVLCAFSLMQFVRLNVVSDRLVFGPLALAVTFAFLFVQDWQMLRVHRVERNYWIRRHLVRMILAFTAAVMALVRIGINFGLSLEASVIVPLTVAAACIAWTYRRYPVSAGTALREPA